MADDGASIFARQPAGDLLWLPQHFVTGPSMRQTASSPMLGWLANMAPQMKLGTAVLLLPMLNPVLLAEEAATLDHLTGGNFTLEYRPTSDDELHLRGLYSQWKNDQLHDYIDVKTGQDDKGAINSFSSLMGAEVKQEDNRLGVLNLGGRHVRSAFELDYDIAYTYGRTETPNQWYMEYVTDGSLPIYSTPIGFDASDSKHPTWVMSEAQSSAMLNPANLKFDYAELYRRISEDSQAYAAVNLAWSPEDKGVLKTVKGGFRFRRSQRDYDQQQDVDSGTRDIPGLAGGSPLSDHSDLIAGSIDHFDDDHYRGLTRFGTILEMNRVLAVLQAAPRVTDDEYPWNLNDSSGRETSYSGYAMAVLERGAWSATAGARVGRTDIHNEALVTTEDAVTGVVTREFGGATGTTEGRPRPVPSCARVSKLPDNWRKRWNNCACCSRERPGPVSLTANTMRPLSAFSRTVTPPLTVNLIALCTKLFSTCMSFVESQIRCGGRPSPISSASVRPLPSANARCMAITRCASGAISSGLPATSMRPDSILARSSVVLTRFSRWLPA